MKKRLTAPETAAVGSMLFGLFFGAGNLIFPVFMGQSAGANVWLAVIGFLITGVGIPLLGVAALGMSRSDGLFQMSSRVGRGYGYFFTILLYLHDRTVFCHSALCFDLIFGRHQADDRRYHGKMARLDILAPFLCRGAVVLATPGQDSHMGRQNTDPAVPCGTRLAYRCGAHLAHRQSG